MRKYANADTFPERSKRTGPSILDSYLVYLKTRHHEGCENASQLWREIQQKGFPGSKRQVLKWMREQRLTPAPTTPGRYVEGVRVEKAGVTKGSGLKLPSVKQLAWLFSQEPSALQDRDALTLERVLQDVAMFIN